MDVREKMITYRKDHLITLKKMSQRTRVSQTLLSMVEGGEVTHPKIVARIQKGYSLTDEEAEMLMPKIHRKSDPEYEPNKYKLPDAAFNPQLFPDRSDVVELYTIQNHIKQSKDHQKRSVY